MRRTEKYLTIAFALTLLLSVQAFAFLSAQQTSNHKDSTVSYAWVPIEGAGVQDEFSTSDSDLVDLVAPTTENNQEELLNYDIFVFPNPNSGKFRIEVSGVFGETVEFRIINVSGKKVYSRQLNQKGEFYMDLTSMRKGIYFAQIKLGNKILSHPIVYAYDE